MNPNNKLTVAQMELWDAALRIEAAELSRLTGLNVTYVGHVSLTPRNSYLEGSSTSADILIFFGPPGSSSLLEADENYFVQALLSWSEKNTGGRFNELAGFQIHVNSDKFGKRVTDSRYIKHYLGRAFGPTSIPSGPRTELMTWGADGSGRYGDPKWGPGDKIAFGLVGASNGCF